MKVRTFLVLLTVTLASFGTAQSQSSLDSKASVTGLRYFGYAAIACDHDDPLDRENKSNYTDEVGGFTNANQVCVTADIDVLERRLRDAAKQFTPIFYVEPVFFKQTSKALIANPEASALWSYVQGAIYASGVDPAELIFYIVDEPTLRGLPLAEISKAADLIRDDYKDARIMMIEAYHGPAAPTIPAVVDYWGFDAYAIRDPNADPRYTEYLGLAGQALLPHQSLAIIMDANHTPYHQSAGISQTDMAEVAANYLRLAQGRTDVSMILGYTWAGGIDNLQELGVRDMPQSVVDAHRAIGREILGNR